MKKIRDILAQHPLFGDLKDTYLDLMAGCSVNEVIKGGDFIFREGKQADYFYLIREGKATLQIDVPARQPLVIRTYQQNDILGWSWAVPPYRWLYDALALETTRVVKVDGKCLRIKCEDDHSFGYEILKRITRVMENRLHATRFQVMDTYGSKD